MQDKSPQRIISESLDLTPNQGFNVHCTDYADKAVKSYSRKDFYKICLYKGECVIEYADKGIILDDAFLFFGTPHIPYAWEDVRKEFSYAALFTEEFLKINNNSESLQKSPLFRIGGTPIFHLNEAQTQNITDVFKKMIAVYDSDYVYKNDLIRNYINLIIHEALQMEPSESFTKHHSASSRVTALFFELLERQFPIESPQMPLLLKTANDFARGLSVHANHLNRAVKEVTGKPTTYHITERIITEAKALLVHTDWNVSQIAFSLGFEYPTYFNNYFKKNTGHTPTAFRISFK